MARIKVTPYKAWMVNHATNNEIPKITVAPHQAGTVNHVMMNNLVKITDTIIVSHMQWAPSTIQMKTD